MNPFRRSPSPLNPHRKKDRSKWVCSKKVWNELESAVEKEENAVILGVEGSGKTTLLNWFFSAQYCAQAVEEGKLVFFADLSDTDDGVDLCSYLLKQLEKSAKKNLPPEHFDILMQSFESSKRDGLSKKRTFISACDNLADEGYLLLLVMDGFERFVSSPSVTQDQHEMLRGLLDKDVMRCIVATNYDLEKSSLPEDVKGSLYLQKFQTKITMNGFSPEEAQQFVANHMESADAVQFTQRHIQFITELTGGIPALFEMAANDTYEMIASRGKVKPSDLRAIVYDGARPTLQRWCKYLTQEYEKVLNDVTSYMPDNAAEVLGFLIPAENTVNGSAAARLKERGLWTVRVRDGIENYTFNSLLLQMYFNGGDYHRQVSAAAPELPQEPTPEPIVQEIHYHFEGNTTIDKLFGGPATITENKIVAIPATKELLSLLVSSGNSQNNFAQGLYEHMTGSLPKNGLIGLERGAMSEAEYEGAYDSAFAKQVSDKVVDSLTVDDDDELVQVTPEEQLSLDQRFEQTRKGTQPNLTDALLGKVSPRTSFYLKLAVVVEDALSTLRLLHTSNQDPVDCSAQLALYGKALEQHLRDSLFPLFRREDNLKNYEINAGTHGWVPFSDVREDWTGIGTFKFAVGDNAEYLGKLCAKNGITYNGQELDADQWYDFWTDLKYNIDDARKIRNLAAHTLMDKTPGWADIDRITELCFGSGSGSIFECSMVGKDLNTAIFGYGFLGFAEGKAMEGSQAVFYCTKVKKNGGLDGYIEGSHCTAKIAPAKRRSYTSAHPETVIINGGRYHVKLLEYREQDGVLFYAAELLSCV